MLSPRALGSVGGFLLLQGCAHGAPSSSTASPGDAASSDVASADAASAPEGEPSSAPHASGILVGGKPLEAITADELVAAAGRLGWLPPKDVPAGMGVMHRADRGRESFNAVFDKAGARLNVMIVRAVPGEKPGQDSTVASAKSTYDSFTSMGKPALLDGESAIVVVDGAIGVKGASKEQMQALLDALTQK